MERELYEKEVIPNRTRRLTQSDLRVTFLMVIAVAIVMQMLV